MLHAWGMTEMSPLGTVSQLKAAHQRKALDDRLAVKGKQGRAIFGVDLKIVDSSGKDLPWDGKAFGDLLVRGPWVAKGYFKGEGGDPLRDGWFPTGDVATIDDEGYMQITDRSKDVIKSGGEWISSIELENVAVAHPGVAEAAVIGVQHPRWDERPLLIVQRKRGRDGDARGAHRLLRGQGREMVGSRRRRLRRGAAAHRDGQAAQDQAARGFRCPPAADRVADGLF